MKAIIILLTVVAVARAVSFIDLVKDEWDLFKEQYGKLYGCITEETYRMKIFMHNKHIINQHNSLYEKGEASFSMKMNEFGDMLTYESNQIMNGYRRKLSKTENEKKGVTYIPPYNVTIPDAVDWRLTGAVTEVKNQGKCGSCWAFSATGSLEGQHFRKTEKLVSLSEQNLVDCSQKYGNDGCEGGDMNEAFLYVKGNNGIDTEESYPYKGEDDHCQYDPTHSGATDKGYVNLPEGDEEKLKIAVATVGPISVAIDANTQSFKFFNEGVYYSKTCSSTDLNHAILVVGYGTSEKGEDYWLVKNSWGTDWGQEGYIKMARNRNNNCGIASAASYPLV